ncbi:N6 adenine-specific DNA-methyltransferase [Methanocella arvoryzae MRE50]|uniref:site-specific DNA-methyltransferase (adenine-specific) n=1 Tax=Methanocella arvoryzae (strain DSM 22066 / NBRC 105507 / MRE50) TaxID=351160 RepID=Q0W8K3_METAR|nr:site-specific DNA-methyltransferase [uncultured archaeon]CAJ35290.1 N6 adenine-specific DNA-methyltransferase [Methanocella arvoryzae MRE50]
MTLANQQLASAKPFLKWAGGKTQLLDELGKRLPANIIEKGVIDRYIEPFVGGGAMFFYLKGRFEVKEAFLYDINPELVLGYKTIQKSPQKLISRLKELEDEYLSKAEQQRQEMFYSIRSSYNSQAETFNYKKYSAAWVDRVAYMIFLNKTCYNGLFRQNSKGGFNVPFGRYKNPSICGAENILAVSHALKNTRIELGDFIKSAAHIEAGTLVYLDPPYRPISTTSSFTSYAKDGFDDDDQRRLAKYFREMDEKKAFLMLSNSDPKNENPSDDFFEQLYAGYRIDRALASRMINCDAKKRGHIYELIITNY